MCRILLLDDNHLFCQSLAQSLAIFGDDRFDVTVTHTIREALEATRKATEAGHPFNALLVDRNLGPGEDGIEAMRYILRISQQTGAIVFTGGSDPDEGLEAYRAGAYRYLLKPFRNEELVLALDEMERHQRLGRERDLLKLFGEIAEKAINCTTSIDAAQVLTEGATKLGFERVCLFRHLLYSPGTLAGVCQAGQGHMPQFEDLRIAMSGSPYLEPALTSQEPVRFEGRSLGPDGIEKAFGERFTPPDGDWVMLPLWTGDELIGIMTLANISHRRHIPFEELQQLQFFARLAAGNLERTRLWERERAERQRLGLLQHASAELFHAIRRDEENFWRILLTLATADYGLSFNCAWVFLAEAGHTRLRGRLGVGHLDPAAARQAWETDQARQMDFEHFLVDLHAGRFRPTPLEELTRDLVIELEQDAGAIGAALANGHPRKLSAEEAQCLPAAFVERFRPGECALMPLRAGQAVVGLLIVDNRHDNHPLQDRTLNRLGAFLEIAGLIWQNQHGHRQRQAQVDASLAIMSSVTQSPLGETLSQICAAACTVTGADWAMIYPFHSGVQPYQYDLENIGRAGTIGEQNMRSRPSPKGVSAYILKNGPLFVEDVQRASLPGRINLVSHHFVASEHIRALIGLPIYGVQTPGRQTMERLGIMYIDFRYTQHFSDDDKRQAEAFASLAAAAILQAHQAAALQDEIRIAQRRGQRSQRELEVLPHMLKSFQASPDEKPILRSLLSSLQEILRPAAAESALVLLEWRANRLEDEPRQIHTRYNLEKRGRLDQLEPNQQSDPHLQDTLDSGRTHQSRDRCTLYVPIQQEERVIGALQVQFANPHQAREYRPALERFASAAALALDNARRQQHLNSVLRAAEAITRPLSLHDSLQAIMSMVRHASPDLSSLSLWYRDPHTRRILLGNSFGVRNPDLFERKELQEGSLVWRVMKLPEPRWAEDAPNDRMLSARFVIEEQIVASAAFPLRADDEEIGAMFFNYRSRHIFTREEKTLFPILAEVVAASIRDALNLEIASRLARRLQAAMDITEAIGATLDLDQVLDQVLGHLAQLFSEAMPCVLLYREDEQVLEFAPASLQYYHLERSAYENLRTLALDHQALVCQAARDALSARQMVVLNIGDITTAPAYLPVHPDTQSELCVGLYSNQLLGVLALESPEINGFDAEEEDLIEAVARQISLAIERANQSAAHSFSATVATQTAWAADLAHDLRRTVGAIGKQAYMISEQTESDSIRRLSEQIGQTARRLSASVPGMSRRQPIPVDSFVENRVLMIARQRPENIWVEFQGSCPGAFIEADPLALERVLRHLVRNAAQAMAENPDDRRLVVRTALAPDNMVEIQFQDNGPGVDDRVRQKIFQAPVSTREGGYGLLLVRQLVEDLNGKIRLLPSPPHTGATFSVRLPRGTNEIQEGAPPENGHIYRLDALDTLSQAPEAGKPRLLVVDNDLEDSQQLADLLLRWGYQPFVISGLGTDLLANAAAAVQRHRCHLALVDMHLLDDTDPDDRSGLDLMPQLRPALTIMTSGSVSPMAAAESIRQGAQAFIGKEEDPKRLRATLDQIAPRACASRRQLKIYPHGLSEQLVPYFFPDDRLTPHDEVNDVLAGLFPEARLLQVEIMEGTVVPDPTRVPRPRNRVLVVRQENRLPEVVKLARSSKIAKEVERYNEFVRGNLVGSFYSPLIQHHVLWDLGGAVYPYLGGKDVHPFPTFFASYFPNEIEEALRRFFTRTWSKLYEERKTDEALNVFEAYNRVWDPDWYQRLTGATSVLPAEVDAMQHWPTIDVPEPINWLRTCIESGREMPTTALAVTHGDLHGDNMLVDDNRQIWVVDFERTGWGPILQDFIELESDIINRLADINDFPGFYRLCIWAAREKHLDDLPVPFSLPNQRLEKTYRVIRTLRRLANEVTRERDARPYLWGLVFNALFRASLVLKDENALIQRPPNLMRSLMFASILAHRLDHWDEPWPPPDWPPAL